MSPSEVILECSFEAAIFKDSSCVRHRKIRYLASYISGRSLDDNNRAIFKSYQKNFYPKEFFSYIIYSLEINISDRCQLIYQKLYMPWCQHRHISPPVARVPLGTNTYKVSCKIAGRLWPWQIMRERVGNKKRQKAWCQILYCVLFRNMLDWCFLSVCVTPQIRAEFKRIVTGAHQYWRTNAYIANVEVQATEKTFAEVVCQPAEARNGWIYNTGC